MQRITHGDPCVNGSRVPMQLPSERLVAANARLQTLRQRQDVGSISADNARSSGWLTPLRNLQADSLVHTPPVTPTQSLSPQRCEAGNHSVSLDDTITLSPDIATAFLRYEWAAIGRIYLLARHLDTMGQGWITVSELRAALTDKTSALRVCGWRRLRQLLQEGKGRLWERDDFGRIWLYGTIRVARHLAITHFSSDQVNLPIQALLGTIGDVRARFYTTFHCGRDASPISRATLQTITGIPERTQRHYDDAQQTQRISNFSLIADQVNQQELTWQHGRAAFTFTDKNGRQGKAGKRYTAIRLPNSYISTRYARLSGKRKRLNQKLKQDLANCGTQGNSDEYGQRLFFTDGKQAEKSVKQKRDVFWRDSQNGTVVFWRGWLQ